ncbi:MAG: transcriptional regulator [Nitriliruptorales bacterium]|nr:transcriptional regulator [Nitriliruptorales bacterium]
MEQQLDYQQALGERLRAVRMQQGLTLQEVEEKSDGEWKAVVVGSYERGDRAVSAAKLARLAQFYGIPISELLPPVSDVPVDLGTSADATPVVIDLARLENTDAPGLAPVARFAEAIKRRRGDYNGRVITLRVDDLDTVAIAMGVKRDVLRQHLERRGILRQTANA